MVGNFSNLPSSGLIGRLFRASSAKPVVRHRSYHSAAQRGLLRVAGLQCGVGPHWKGTLPDKVVPIHVDSDRIWILGRLLVDGEQDLPAALELLDKFWANPLSQWRRGKPEPLPIPARSEAVDPMNSLAYFAWLNAALKASTQHQSEEALIAQFKQIGVGPFDSFGKGNFSDSKVELGKIIDRTFGLDRLKRFSRSRIINSIFFALIYHRIHLTLIYPVYQSFEFIYFMIFIIHFTN